MDSDISSICIHSYLLIKDIDKYSIPAMAAATGSISFGHKPELVKPSIKSIRKQAAENGRHPKDIKILAGAST